MHWAVLLWVQTIPFINTTRHIELLHIWRHRGVPYVGAVKSIIAQNVASEPFWSLLPKTVKNTLQCLSLSLLLFIPICTSKEQGAEFYTTFNVTESGLGSEVRESFLGDITKCLFVSSSVKEIKRSHRAKNPTTHQQKSRVPCSSAPSLNVMVGCTWHKSGIFLWKRKEHFPYVMVCNDEFSSLCSPY